MFDINFTGEDIIIVIGFIIVVDIFFIPFIKTKSLFENKTKKKDKVTTVIIVIFLKSLED